MGLLLNVYRTTDDNDPDGLDLSDDCTLGGISSKFNRLCVVNVPGPFEPSDEWPAVEIGIIVVGKPHAFIRPVGVKHPEMFCYGGNLAASSDDRFSRTIEKMTGYPSGGVLRIHDRDMMKE